MAFSTYYYRDEPNTPNHTFLCDTRDDISALPNQKTKTSEYPTGVPAGSKAFVTADTSVWILNNAGIWVEL